MSALIPGIPVLPPGVERAAVTLLAAAAVSSALWQASQVPPKWGIFDSSGALALDPDSILEFSNRQEYEVSNFPVQSGSFASYNKVIRPFEITLRLKKGGDENDRAVFLTGLALLAASLELFSIVTPERVYPDVNLERYEVIRRGAKGAYQLTEVDAYFIQVIQVQPQYTTTAVQLPNAQVQSAVPQSNVGNVQPQAPTPPQTVFGNDALGAAFAGTY